MFWMLLPFALCALASAISNRAMDPLILPIAREFGVPVATAALATSFYALPYAFGQPLLGPIGDFYGKIKVLRFCLWLQALCLLAVVLSPTLTVLLAARLVGGFAGGGIMPVTMAIIGDRVPPAQRQLAMGQFLSAGMTGMIFATTVAGLLAEYINWRAIFVIGLAVALTAAATMTFKVNEPSPDRQGERISFAHAAAGYKKVFANPRALICFGAVFTEGIAIYGVLPFIGLILEMRGLGGAKEAGLIIAGVGIGGLIYSLSLKWLLKIFSRYQLMFIGGFFASAGIISLSLGLAWQISAALFCLTGMGYMLMHNSIQAEVAGLTTDSRGSAFSMHSFSLFCGQALGPLLVGPSIYYLGVNATLIWCGLVLLALGPLIAFLFARQRSLSGTSSF
ncbi:MFS transporter [Roseiarcaceae bacterium H3SJ34-1]|uniref:MFS transporter n=1 Tax=Terripilifer ovatus TaxID=3032367 RepID=UPI003AB9978B|nr:MFS transporter [Roseiarcaceae bacterium H3SJ34-1]